MVLQRLHADTVGIKLAQGMAHLTRDEQIKVGDRQTEGPGEYDIAGVGIHLVDHAGVLFTEGVRIGVMWPHDQKVDLSEDINSDVMIFFMTDVKEITSIMKEQDPRVIVLTDAATADEVAKQDGVEVIKEGSYKVTAQSLPVEDRVFVLLS